MSDDAAAKARAKASVEALFQRYHLIAAGRKHFDYDVMTSIQLVSASPSGSVEYTLPITPAYANLNGVMHGGAAGVIFDMCTTTALCPIARPGFWEFLGGVTRSLNISYLRAVPVGTTVRIKSRVVQAGRTMALIKGEMTSLDGETVYATVEHHKVNTPVLEEHRKARVAWDEEWDQLHRVAKGVRSMAASTPGIEGGKASKL